MDLKSQRKLPSLYAIVDRATLDDRGVRVRVFAEELRDGGVRLLQYRDKKNGPQEVLRASGEIAEVFAGTEAMLVLNDRADLAALLGWGCHVGQNDLPVEAVRRLLESGHAAGAEGIIGVSTHQPHQVVEAEKGPASYVAIGPVFATFSKDNPEPVVGLEGVRAARALTSRPLVAIGGISLETADAVRKAGADSIAVIGALLPRGGRSTRQQCENFLSLLGG